jgi:hypothetical protein
MPSLTHEGIVRLFRNRPELAPELLRDALAVALPAYTAVRVESADLPEIVPTEYRADLVVLLVDGTPVFAIVVEVQLKLEAADDKFFKWPCYVANLRARFRCEACVLVVTPSEAVATRASTPIRLGPGSTVTPLVVGPKAVPVIVDEAVAKRDPELAVLSVMAHGGDEPELAVRIAITAESAAAGLDAERALLYSDLIRISLGEAARLAFEALMATGDYQFQSEFHKKHEAVTRAAVTKANVDAVLSFLEARSIPVSAEQRERIEACTDLDVLHGWVRKAATITSASELFTD